MPRIRERWRDSSPGTLGEFLAGLTLFAAPTLGAFLGASHGLLWAIAGLPIGLLAGLILVLVGWNVWRVYATMLGASLECFESVHRGLGGRSFPLWAFPLLGGFGVVPLGLGLWLALAVWQWSAGRPLPSLLGVVGGTVCLTLLGAAMATALAGAVFWVASRPWFRALESRPVQPAWLVPVGFTAILLPMVAGILVFHRALDFFIRPDRLARASITVDLVVGGVAVGAGLVISIGAELYARRRNPASRRL